MKFLQKWLLLLELSTLFWDTLNVVLTTTKQLKSWKKKVKLALANNLKPIFCIGEVLEEREANKQNEVVEAQLASVFSLSAEDFGKVILAYEPVWAIGTGKTATPEQAGNPRSYPFFGCC